jgi:hypothetical protein
MYITSELAEAISIRIKDVLTYHPQRDVFIKSLGRFTVGALKELENVHMHDFGVFIELDPDEDEKQLVENNIQAALSRDQIQLEDVIDIRAIKNIKLANQLLKFRRVKKATFDQIKAERNIAAQSEANAKAAQAAEMAKAQSENMKVQAKVKLSEAQKNFDIQKLQSEASAKKELMQFEFDLNMKLKRMELDSKEKVELSKPIRSAKPNKAFESKGNDVLGGLDLSRFEPK